MNPLPVSAKRLTNRTVRLRDALLPNCALLPLFTARGATAKVALFSAETRECWVFDWRPDLVYVPVFRAAQVDVARGMSQRTVDGGSLWFFDPKGAIEVGMVTLCGRLSARNAATALPGTVAGLRWRRDLSRISGVWIKEMSKGGISLAKWDPKWLDSIPPPSPVAGPSTRPTRQWVLDPIWMG
jgi:hypothetical protein